MVMAVEAEVVGGGVVEFELVALADGAREPEAGVEVALVAGEEPGEGVEVALVGLTERQAAAMAFVEDYVRAHGRSPLLREIAAGLGVKRECQALDALCRLEAKGALARAPRHQKRAPLAVAGMPPRDPARAPLTEEARRALSRIDARERVGAVTRIADLAAVLGCSPRSSRTVGRVTAELERTGCIEARARCQRGFRLTPKGAWALVGGAP